MHANDRKIVNLIWGNFVEILLFMFDANGFLILANACLYDTGMNSGL